MLEKKAIEEQAFRLAPEDSIDNPAYPNCTDTDIFVEGFKSGVEWAIEETQPKWIEVNDRLPNDTDYVLIYTVKQKLIKKGFFMIKDQWDRPNMFYAEMGFFSVSDITHWMPLPNPPQEQ